MIDWDKHWPTWVDGENLVVEQISICACGEARADGVRPYKEIWAEHMNSLSAPSPARGEQFSISHPFCSNCGAPHAALYCRHCLHKASAPAAEGRGEGEQE
jgi:hypothetical protein